MNYRKLILIFALFSTTSWARTWTVIHKAIGPHGPFVVINAGSDDGITKTSRICIIDPDRAALGCSQVQALQAKAAGIPLTPTEYETIALGSIAVLDGNEPIIANHGVWRRRLSGRLISPLAQPIIYNAIRFSDAARSNATLPPWVKVDTIRTGAWGFATSWEQPLNDDFGLSTGIHFSVNNNIENRLLLQPVSAGISVTTLTYGYHYGLASGVDWKIFRHDRFLLQSGLGVAMLNGNVETSTESRNDGVTAKIAKYQESLWALATEADLEAHYATGDLAVFTGFRLVMPLAQVANSYTGSTNFDAVDLGDASYAVAAIRKAVKLRTALGYALELGISLAL